MLVLYYIVYVIIQNYDSFNYYTVYYKLYIFNNGPPRHVDSYK